MHPLFTRGTLCAIGLFFFLSFASSQSAEPADAKRFSKSEIQPRIWSCDFFSSSLGKPMRFMAVLPEKMPADGACPVIYFFHGRGRHEKSLLESPTVKKRLLESSCIVILPRGEDGWYIDSPIRPADRYAGYVDEIIANVEANFSASKEAGHRGIAGWSMGGYGAIMTAIRRPNDFHAAASIIGLLDFPRPPISEAGQNYGVPAGRFGSDPEAWKKLNPRYFVANLQSTKLFLVIGEQAFDRQMNDTFIQAAKDSRIQVESVRLPGMHSFETVAQGVPLVLDFLEKNLSSAK